MSISTELTNLQQDITNARNKIVEKGGSVTSGGGSSQLANDINTIPAGVTPTGTISITTNGTHDVTNYASANVNVPSPTKWGASIEDFYNTSVSSTPTLHDVVIPSGEFNRPMNYMFRYSTIKSFTAYGPASAQNSYQYSYMIANNPYIESITLNRAYGGGTYVYAYGLSYFAQNCTNLKHFENNLFVPSTSSQGCYAICDGCTNLEDFTFNYIANVSSTNFLGNAFKNCVNLTKFRLSSNGVMWSLGNGTSNNHFNYTFRNCYKMYDEDINHIQIPNLNQVGYNSGTSYYGGFRYAFTTDNSAYYGKCHLILPELVYIYNRNTTANNGHFSYCNALGKIYLPKFTTDGTTGKNIFTQCAYLTEIHFGIENQATIQALAGYSSKFGATNSTLYFDMPNHLTCGGVVYDRSGAEYDYDNSYYSWKNGSNVIYTTNAINPQVNDNYYTKSGNNYVVAGTIGAIS